MQSTSNKARIVCTTIGSPASGTYCLGPDAPDLAPTPAQGTTANTRGGDDGPSVMPDSRIRPDARTGTVLPLRVSHLRT